MDNRVVKENTIKFLDELITDLENVRDKYGLKIPEPSYNIVKESLNEIQQVISLVRIWKQRTENIK